MTLFKIIKRIWQAIFRRYRIVVDGLSAEDAANIIGQLSALTIARMADAYVIDPRGDNFREDVTWANQSRAKVLDRLGRSHERYLTWEDAWNANALPFDVTAY